MPALEHGGQFVAAKLLGAAEEDIYRAPLGRRVKLEAITVSNTGASARAVSLRRVRRGQAAAASGVIYAAVALAGNASIVDEAVRYLHGGDALTGWADAAGEVVVTVDGEMS